LHNKFLKEKEREKEASRRDEEKRKPNIAIQISRPSYGADWSKIYILLKKS
jgi:hypothetical protein